MDSFITAKPVWIKDRALEMNLTAGFRANIKKAAKGKTVLRLAASAIYRFFINGKFTGHGPARGPHGYYRIDEWDITELLDKDVNILAIEVAGYNSNSYYTLDQPSFLTAEVLEAGKVAAATGTEGKEPEAFVLGDRVQKVQRYSFQRPFSESYRLDVGYENWHVDAAATQQETETSLVETKSYLPSRITNSIFDKIAPKSHVSHGKFVINEAAPKPRDRYVTNIGDQLKGYREEECEFILTDEVLKADAIEKINDNREYKKGESIVINVNEFDTLDFGTNFSGFIGIRVKCPEDTKMVITFDEILKDGEVDFLRLECVNAISLEMKAGTYEFESFEPYTLRYLKLMAFTGKMEMEDIYIREYTNPEADKADFKCSDTGLNKIFEAGRETFKQNAVDIYMDCPSRERAGWLCDSFFTSRVEYDLTGKSLIEKNFLENYLLPETFKCLPEGMLPMCYPADHYDGVFIPNWPLWLVLELEEYLGRTGDRELVDAFRPRIEALFNYFKAYKNEDGLLEKLNGWVFLEWSKANEFVQDVNYPSNMLYSAALSAAGRMYGNKVLLDESWEVKKAVLEQSFDGSFFIDNAVRIDGQLVKTSNRTEVCQYYAFFTGIADEDKFGGLLKTLMEGFGPKRSGTGAYPDIYPANAFIGNYLRMELLSKYGYSKQIIYDIKDYFLYMADRTGTLWEHNGDYASCNHGFASHIIHCLYRDALGIEDIDNINKRIVIRIKDVELDCCKGKLPLKDGFLSFSWKVQGNAIQYSCSAPDGYSVDIADSADRKIVGECEFT